MKSWGAKLDCNIPDGYDRRVALRTARALQAVRGMGEGRAAFPAIMQSAQTNMDNRYSDCP